RRGSPEEACCATSFRYPSAGKYGVVGAGLREAAAGLRAALGGRTNAALRGTNPESTKMQSARSDGRYAKECLAGWVTMDFNGHMANTAYLDLAADVRMAFFAEHGFPPGEFRRLGIGPVMQKDEVEYFREVGLHDAVTVTYALLAMSADGSRFVIENEIWLTG